MKITKEKYESFKDLMFKVAQQHDCTIKMDYDYDYTHGVTKVFISDALVPNSEYHIYWSKESSLTEAAVTIWAHFFSGKDSNIKYPFENYVKYDIESTKMMIQNVRNSKYGTLPSISRVIFNAPATIVFWSDKTKTVVKAQGEDEFDPEKGLVMAISKKALGNKGGYYNVFDKWIEEPLKEDNIANFIRNLPSCDDDFWTSIRNRILGIKVTADKNGKVLKKEVTEAKESGKKYDPVAKAYTALVRAREEGEAFDIGEVIGYLGEALAE